MNSESDPREGGFVASFHRLGDTLLQVVTTRLEIISTELKEEPTPIPFTALAAVIVGAFGGMIGPTVFARGPTGVRF